jgi:hypothetical protein
MIAPTVDHPQGRPETIMQPGYLGYLMQAAIDFGNDIGVEPWQVNAMVEVFISPVDGLE